VLDHVCGRKGDAMNPRKASRLGRLYYRLCALVLFFAAAAASFNGYFGISGINDANAGSVQGKGTFEREVDGTDLQPFVYRRLLPTIANWVNDHVSQQDQNKLYNLRGRTGLLFRDRIINSPLARDRKYFLRYWVMYALVFLSAWIALPAMYLAGKAAGLPPPAAVLAALSVIIIIPYIQSGNPHYYDYTELAFVMLTAWMAMKFDWWWMLPLAAVATFNLEAFLAFVPALYPLIRQRTSRIQAVIGTASTGVTCAIVYEAVRWRFRNNPYEPGNLRLLLNIHYLLTNPWDLRGLVLAKTYGIWAPPTLNLLTIVLVVWSVWRAWRILPQHLQRHIQIAAVINIPLYLLFCAPGELRDFCLLYFGLVLLLGANITIWMGGSFASPEKSGAGANAGEASRPQSWNWGGLKRRRREQVGC
jgi:hypothetical protein